MVTLGRKLIAGRKLLHDLHVRGEPSAGENPLEQVVAEEAGFGNTASKRRLKDIHIVDAFARVGPFAEQVLVHVGDRCSVGIDAGSARENTKEQRALPSDRQCWCHPRLQHGVTFDDSRQFSVETRPIERMSHLADKAPDRLPRETCV